MKELVKSVVLCLVFLLAVGIIPAWVALSADANSVQAESVEVTIEVANNDLVLSDRISEHSAIKEIGINFKAIPVGEMFFYLGRPYMPFISWSWLLAGNIIAITVFFFLSVLVHALFPARIKAVGQAVKSDTGGVIGRGFLGVLLIVPAMLVLAITIIGIPLVLLVVGVAGILGYAAIALIVGEKLLSGENPVAALALGVLIVGVLTMIPILGWLLSVALFIVALGAIITTRFGTVSPQA